MVRGVIVITTGLFFTTTPCSANSLLELWSACPKSWTDKMFSNDFEKLGLYSSSVAIRIRLPTNDLVDYDCDSKAEIRGWSPLPMEVSCHQGIGSGSAKDFNATLVIKKLNALEYSVMVSGRGDSSAEPLLCWKAVLTNCRKKVKS